MGGPLRLLYVAIDQKVPGTLGGSVHVQAVAEGLARLGHEVHVATQAGGAWPAGTVTWHPMRPPLGRSELRWTRQPAVGQLAREIRADAIIERYYNFGGEGILAAGAIGVPAILEVNAPIVDYPGSSKARLDRALVVEPMRRWRDRICRATDLFVTPAAEILPAWIDRDKVLEIEWGADVDHFRPDAPRPPAFTRDPRARARRVCRRVSDVARRRPSVGVAGATACRRRSSIRRRVDRRWPRAAGRRARRARRARHHLHRRGAASRCCRAGWRKPTSASRRSTRHVTGRCGSASTGRRSRSSSTWPSVCPVLAPALPRLRRLVEHGREGWLYDPDDARGLDRALEALADPDRRRVMGAAARARVVQDFSWTAHCRALDGRLRELVSRVSAPLRVLLVTDSFPPGCGGSGWSTWELAHGLVARGHHVEVVKAAPGPRAGVFTRTYEGLPVTDFCRPAPNVPVLRNIVKNERLWASLGKYLTARLVRDQFDIVHGQHVMTTVPSIRAGAASGIPSVATVRDYWPVCYWSDLIYDPTQPSLCPHCTAGMMTRCVRPRAGAATVAAWPLIPYMRSNLRAKRQTLAGASAVIAVSHALADDLRAARAGARRHAALHDSEPGRHDGPRPRARSVGAADRRAVRHLLRQARHEQRRAVPAGRGQGRRHRLAARPRGRRSAARRSGRRGARAQGIPLRVLGWQDREAVLPWMRHAALLAFPSYGPESLSRVLIEAAAMGVPIAAMETGGTRDIIRHEATGLLSTDPAGFSRDLARLASDERLRASLGAAARADVHVRFSAASVVERVEQVYRALLLPRAA